LNKTQQNGNRIVSMEMNESILTSTNVETNDDSPIQYAQQRIKRAIVIPPIREHTKIPEQYHTLFENVKFVGNPTEYMGIPKYLGIDQNFTASYYIGASWLIKNELAVVVTPKMENIDFVQMFLTALRMEEKHKKDYFSKCYDICLDEPQIVATTQLSQLTPMLVLHYISLLYRLAQRGLKKNYVIQEENLKSKVKGRIMMGRNLQKNVFVKRADRVFCQFQEYTDDTPENRLLKRALLFADKFVNSSMRQNHCIDKISHRLSRLKTQFSHISDDIEPYQIQHLATNKLYKDYRDAIRVAKMLLRRFDYSIAKVDDDNHSTPPFWIDMSRLYEIWVWSKLEEKCINKILFQESGYYGRQVADFVIRKEKLILDAKYKSKYQNDSYVDIDDVRELSGNARDERLLPNLPEDYSPRCIILYPGVFSELKPEIEKLFCEQGTKISNYRNFYKISVPLPT